MINPPIFDLPNGGSLVAGIANAVSRASRNFAAMKQEQDRMDMIKAETARQQKRQELADQISSEDRLINLAPALPEFESGGTPVQVPGVKDDELGIDTGPTTVPIGTQKRTAPLLTELTLPSGKKVPIAPIHGSRERNIAESEAAQQAALTKGTEILTQEAWDKLPELYKARWKPGQRVDSGTVGSIGMEIFKAANAKAAAEAAAGAADKRQERSIAAADARSAREIAAADARATRTAKTATGKMYTDSKSGNRVMMTDDEYKAASAAEPGRYSDIKPATPRINISGQIQQGRESAAKLFGSSSDTNGDSLWALVNRLNVVPGGDLVPMIAGPTAKVIGMGHWAGNKTGTDPDAQLYASQIEGFIPLFARSVGHTGVLTEKDVQRTEKLFPKFGDTKAVAVRKMNRIQNIISGKETLPAGIFDPQEGKWPPSAAGTGEGPSTDLTPDEEALAKKWGL